jgi:amino acid adenylation domain-containing protein
VTLGSLFDDSASKSGARVALECDGLVLTYRELQQVSQQAAHRLDGLAAGPVVGVLADSSPASYASYLGILRSGRSALPLPVGMPGERLAEVVQSSQLRHCLVGSESTNEPTRSLLDSAGLDVVTVSDAPVVEQAFDPGSVDRQESFNKVAYVLYTSGSTGRPKGVPVEHRNAEAFLANMLPLCGANPDSRFSQNFDLTFDPSVYDLFAAWAVGAAVVVPSMQERLAPVRYVEDRGLTHWCSVPSTISLLGQEAGTRAETLVFSAFIGEPLLYADVLKWREAMPRTQVVNIYGPTELAIACSAYVLPDHPSAWVRTANETVPIGDVFTDQEFRLVDEAGRNTSRGELCIRGSQRFGGYVAAVDNVGRFLRGKKGEPLHPAVTTEVTADDWYRTGDLVEDLAGIGLLHLGRTDRQVKVRGYRIELEEVEGVLRRSDLFDAVCVVTIRGRQGIAELGIGYCGRQVSTAEVMAAIGVLPAYMRPTRMTQLATLPLTANGKLDYAQVVHRLEHDGERLQRRRP